MLVCPHCGGVDVENDLSKDMLAWSATTRMICNKCNYSAPVFPKIAVEKIPIFKKRLKKRTKEQEQSMVDMAASKGFIKNKFTKLLVFLFLCYYLFIDLLGLIMTLVQKNIVWYIFFVRLVSIGILLYFIYRLQDKKMFSFFIISYNIF